VRPFDIAPPTEKSTSETLRYGTHCQGITQFYPHSYAFIHKRNEVALAFPDIGGSWIIPTPERRQTEST